VYQIFKENRVKIPFKEIQQQYKGKWVFLANVDGYRPYEFTVDGDFVEPPPPAAEVLVVADSPYEGAETNIYKEAFNNPDMYGALSEMDYRGDIPFSILKAGVTCYEAETLYPNNHIVLLRERGRLGDDINDVIFVGCVRGAYAFTRKTDLPEGYLYFITHGLNRREMCPLGPESIVVFNTDRYVLISQEEVDKKYTGKFVLVDCTDVDESFDGGRIIAFAAQTDEGYDELIEYAHKTAEPKFVPYIMSGLAERRMMRLGVLGIERYESDYTDERAKPTQ